MNICMHDYADDKSNSGGLKMHAPIAHGAEKSPFRFRQREKVKVVLNGQNYFGQIVTRCESHTGGISYAVHAKYMHGTEAYWFSERDIALADGLDAGTTTVHKMRG